MRYQVHTTRLRRTRYPLNKSVPGTYRTSYESESEERRPFGFTFLPACELGSLACLAAVYVARTPVPRDVRISKKCWRCPFLLASIMMCVLMTFFLWGTLGYMVCGMMINDARLLLTPFFLFSIYVVAGKAVLVPVSWYYLVMCRRYGSVLLLVLWILWVFINSIECALTNDRILYTIHVMYLRTYCCRSLPCTPTGITAVVGRTFVWGTPSTRTVR